MFLIAYNSPSSEYHVDVGWVLPVTRDCVVCGDLAATRTTPHPVDCHDRPDPRSLYTMDSGAPRGTPSYNP